MSLADPSRDDMISIFGETTGTLALKYMQEKMIVDPEGERILKWDIIQIWLQKKFIGLYLPIIEEKDLS